MTEQVIDIRDRIEKMRTQMTGGSSSAVRKKEEFSKPVKQSLNKQILNNQNSLEKSKQVNVDTSKSLINKGIKNEDLNNESSVSLDSNKKIKPNIEDKISQKNFHSELNTNSKIDFDRKVIPEDKNDIIPNKIYKDYHNENTYDDKKKSVKFDQDQQFPQFNLNVSNPISWKLMLLIMLMQLLTNIMLVVVLYLK